MKEVLLVNIIGIIINNLIPISKKRSREIGMIVSIINLNIILAKILTFNNNNNEYQDRIDFLGYSFGWDGLGISLIGLIAVIEPIIILLVKGEKKEEKERKRIINNLLLIKILLIILFSTLDLFIFFISFELILIPMFILITRYGSKYKYFLPRLEAGLRFFIFTMMGSLLMLISIIIFYTKFGTTSNELLNIKISHIITIQDLSQIKLLQIIWLFLFFSFLIKIPMFPFHTWLPLAHSDAPTIGSIILAAILLKLGSFGILRYSLLLFTPLTSWKDLVVDNNVRIYDIYLPVIYILALLSIFYSSILTIRGLFDLKKIIAYSSIIHMNFSIFGFFSQDYIGLIGSTLLIFTHAFISSALFILIGILYKRYHSRFLFYYQGLANTLPLFSFFFILFSFANISLPFCSSFLSELFILISTYHANPIISLLLSLSLIFSSSFVMWFAIRLLFGLPSPHLISLITTVSSYKDIRDNLINQNKDSSSLIIGYKDLTYTEFMSLFPFLFFTIFFTFFPKSIISIFSLSLLFFI